MQVLQDSLCGSSKVMLVCNLSPEAASATETLSSLNFASRAAQVQDPPLSILSCRVFLHQSASVVLAAFSACRVYLQSVRGTSKITVDGRGTC